MGCADQILCERRSWGERRQEHAHRFGQLVFPLRGETRIQTDWQDALLDDTKLLFLPPDCSHVFSSRNGNVECLVVDVPASLTTRAPQLIGYAGEVIEVNGDWQALRLLMLSESERQNPTLEHLLFHSFHLLHSDVPASIRYLREHCYETVSIETLAAMEHYHVAYYGQWFQRRMGMTPHQYLRLLRVGEAKRLLVETNYPLSQIAQYVGYSHQSHLTHVFKEIEKITPCLYRTQNRRK